MAVEQIPFTEARAHLTDLLGRVSYGGERIVLTRHGRVAAALVPVADLERLETMDQAVGGEVIPLRHGSFDQSAAAGVAPPQRMDVAARLGDAVGPG